MLQFVRTCLFAALSLAVTSRFAFSQSITPINGPRVGQYAAVRVVSVSRDGSRFAVANSDSTTVYSTESGVATALIPHGSLPGDDVFSPDGKRMIVVVLGANGVLNGHTKIVDTSTGKTVTTLKEPSERGLLTATIRPGAAAGAAFSPDGKMVAVSAGTLYHYYVDLYDAKTGERIGELLADIDGGPRQLVFSADGRTLVVTHGDNYWLDISAYANWPNLPKTAGDLKRDDKGKPIFSHVLKVFRGIAQRFWFDPTDSLKGSMVIDGVVTPVSASATTPPPNGNPIKIASTNDPQYARFFGSLTSAPMATLEGDTVLLTDAAGHLVGKIGGPPYDNATCAAFSGDGRICVVGRVNGTADVWKLPASESAKSKD